MQHMLYTLPGTTDYLEAREALQRGERPEMEVSFNNGVDWEPLTEGIPVDGFKYRVLSRHAPMSIEDHLVEIDNIQAEIKKLQEQQQAWVNIMSKRYGPWVICKENLHTGEKLYYCERENGGPGFYPGLYKVREFKSPRDADFCITTPRWYVMSHATLHFKIYSVSRKLAEDVRSHKQDVGGISNGKE